MWMIVHREYWYYISVRDLNVCTRPTKWRKRASSNGRFCQKRIAQNDKSSQFHGPFAMQLENDEFNVFFRHTRQLSNDWKRRRSGRCACSARTHVVVYLRGESIDDDFAKHGHRYFTRRGNRATRHQKRFSLIDLEGPRELDWNAPERYSIKFIPRDGKTALSIRALFSSPFSHPWNQPCPRLKPPSSRSLLFPFLSPFSYRLVGLFPTFVLAHTDVVQYLHTDR